MFKHIFQNYAIVSRVLENTAATDDRRAKEAKDLLCRIRNFDFVLKVMLCTDLYRVLGEVS